MCIQSIVDHVVKYLRDLIQVRRISYLSYRQKDHLRVSFRYHKKILEALIRRGKALVERLTREHVLTGLAVQRNRLIGQP